MPPFSFPSSVLPNRTRQWCEKCSMEMRLDRLIMHDHHHHHPILQMSYLSSSQNKRAWATFPRKSSAGWHKWECRFYFNDSLSTLTGIYYLRIVLKDLRILQNYLDTVLCRGVSTDTGVAYPGSEGSSSGSVSSRSSLPECHQATHQARTAAKPFFWDLANRAFWWEKTE